MTKHHSEQKKASRKKKNIQNKNDPSLTIATLACTHKLIHTYTSKTLFFTVDNQAIIDYLLKDDI